MRNKNKLSLAAVIWGHKLITSFSWPCARRISRAAADLGRVMDRQSRKERMLKRLKEVFPHMQTSELRILAGEVYRWLFESMVDALFFHNRILDGYGGDHVEFINTSGLKMPEHGTGIIFASGHFGWWEVGGMSMAFLGYPCKFVVRPMKNRALDAYVTGLRESHGLGQLPKKGALRAGLKALKKGENLGFLIDQDARYYGIFVGFLGKTASTYSSPAQLSVVTGAPVVFSYCLRKGDSERFLAVVKDIVYPDQNADREEEVSRITQRLNDNLSELVRAYPERWLWLHRRWKTYPGKYPGQKPGPTDRPVKVSGNSKK